MKGFEYPPSNIDLYKAIWGDYFKAVRDALKGGKKVNTEEIFKKYARAYWSTHRSKKESFDEFLADLNEIKQNRKKQKRKVVKTKNKLPITKASAVYEVREIGGQQLSMHFP